MFGQTFYHSTIRKYVTLVGTLFNDISIVRTDSKGNTNQLIKVPITYANKDKMLSRVMEDPTITKKSALELPLMSFEMLPNFQYDPDRKLNTSHRISYSNTASNSANYMLNQYMSVPYNINFNLYIYIKNTEDGLKIIEQILPYFTPDWTTSVILIPELNIKQNIPVVLNGVNLEDKFDGNFEDRRIQIWILSLTLKGWLFGPIQNSAIIKYTNTEFFTSYSNGAFVANSSPVAYIQGQPGLTANGQPTSNAANSIPVNQILANSDFGFVTNLTEPLSI